MKYDQSAFRVAQSYADPKLVEDRVRRFMPMVRRAAWHIHGSGRDGLEIEDLMQAGLVALTECARKHNGPNEDGFAAYAKIRVRGAMLDLVRKLLPNSRVAVERRRQLRDKTQELTQRLGRDPHAGELAAAMDITVEELAELEAQVEAVRLTPLDQVYDDSNTAFADETPDAFDLLSDSEMREGLIRHIAELPERLKLVLQLYFVEELNLSEIAQVLEVSVPRVHQLKAQAIDKLRVAMTEEADF